MILEERMPQRVALPCKALMGRYGEMTGSIQAGFSEVRT